jgi:hypothetical protein
VAGSHESSVQGFPSSQAAASPWTQPVAGSHESSVQALPSSQLGAAPPTQAPPEHVSPVVQAFPSSQVAALSVWTQPVAGLQESSVQALASSQSVAPPPTQLPAAQASPVVQGFPSSHDAVLFVWTQPVAGLHESSVQTLPSLQLGAGPLTHAPPMQTSPTVHKLPSSQAAVLAV